ncbi:hypothetical protein C8R43DRAFT_865417, partial [Mycena crocata]
TDRSIVCVICLGTHPDVARCRSTSQWNGSPARCSRDQSGRLINNRGINICLNFQLARGCQGRTGQKHIHECSGCGNRDHGASSC